MVFYYLIEYSMLCIKLNCLSILNGSMMWHYCFTDLCKVVLKG